MPARPALPALDDASAALVTPPPAVDAALDAADAAAASDAGVVGTGGHGGLACTRTDDLGGGRLSCVTKVGSVELKLAFGKSTAANAGQPLRLGLYVHGDGATAHIDNSVLQAMLPWADAVHGIAVSALAPNGCAWWLGPSYDCSGSESPLDVTNANAAALASALDAVLHAYDVRTDGMRYYSASGGSIFLTYEWIPLHGGSHPGVLALMCGGVVSDLPFAWDTNDAALRARVPTWFTYGSEDGLRPQIEQTSAEYLAKGFSVTTKMIPNQGHCTFDAHAEAMAIWLARP
jgi:pimeloyl-ACP methyl ester carboxylesterase